jgi:hypothetical protein
MSLIVHIQDQAFQAMLIASIETFPSSYLPPKPGKTKRSKDKPHDGEAMGLLFGQRLLKAEHLVFNVSLAVTMQATERGAGGVDYSRFHFERIREITESFPYLEFLGALHSHPWSKQEYGNDATEPSEADEETAIDAACEYGDELLEIILGITALSRNSYREAKADGHSIDSCCGRYKYRLSAYCTVGAVDEEIDDSDEEAVQDGEAGLLPVDKLICPIAAHGGGIFT